MANPIPYNQLFDIDGLKAAIKDAEQTSDAFGTAVTEDFKRSQSAAAALRKELEGINAAMSGKTIKLTDDSGQAAIQQYAQQVANLTKQYKDQQAAIDNMNKVLSSNKQVISDAKTAQAQYTAELAKGKVATESIKTSIANTTLQMKQLALANKDSAQSVTAATGSYKAAQQQLTALGNSIKNAKDGFTSTNPAIKEQIAQYNALNDKLKAFDATMGNHQRNVGSYQQVLSGFSEGLKGYLTNIISFAAAVELVNKTFETAMEVDATRTSLGYILESTELADEKMRMLKETANRLGLEFTTTAKAYALFTGAAKASNFSLTEADKIFNSVSRVLGVLHVPAEGAQRAFYALQEMISMGTIQSRQLNRMLGLVIPGSTKIMADALGVTVKQLEEMEKHGDLLTSDVLPKFAAQLDKAIAPGVTQIDSMQAHFNDLKNSFSEAVDDNSNINKFFTNILKGFSALAKSITTLVNSSSWLELKTRLFTPNGIENSIGDKVKNLEAGSNNSFDASVQGQVAFKFPGDKGAPDNNQVLKNVNDLKIALAEARKTYEGLKEAIQKGEIKEEGNLTFKRIGGTIEALKSTIELYKNEYPDALKVTDKVQKELSDDQLTSIEEIRKRITELSKLPGSAILGSDINLRIDALKKRLHDLQPSLKAAKDGFAALEEQANKLLLKLQDQIIRDFADNQGKATKRTYELAEAYTKVEERIKAMKKAQDEALLDIEKQHKIKNLGSLSPLPTIGDNEATPSKKTQNSLTIAQDNSDIEADEKKLDAIYIKYDEWNEKIIDLYKKREITKEQMDDRMRVNDKLQATEEYENILDSTNKQLEVAKLTYGEDSKQYSALLLRKANLTKAYNKGILDAFIKEIDAEKKKIEEAYRSVFDTVEKGANIAGEATGNKGVGNTFSDLGKDIKTFSLSHQPGEQAVTDAQKFQMAAQLGMDATEAYTDYAINASKRRQEALEKEMQYEIQGAGNNALAKQRIEAEYNKKILAEKQKQAKLAKASAAIQIILNTAIAISKTAAETGIFGIPLIPIIAALGAVELGVVLAQPIPQFAKGREDGPATIAEVNERGPEALVKGSRVRFANKGKRGVTFLEKGEKVIRADKTSEMINRQIAYQNESAENISQSRMIYDRYVATHTGSSNIDYDKMGAHLSDAVSKLPFEQNIMDERGFSRYIVTKNARIKAVRERNTL